MHFLQSDRLPEPNIYIFYSRIGSDSQKYAFFTVGSAARAKSMHFLQSDRLPEPKVCIFYNRIGSQSQKYAFFTIGSQILDPKLRKVCFFYSRISDFGSQTGKSFLFQNFSQKSEKIWLPKNDQFFMYPPLTEVQKRPICRKSLFWTFFPKPKLLSKMSKMSKISNTFQKNDHPELQNVQIVQYIPKK